MRDRRLVALRSMRRQPLHEPVHGGDIVGLCRFELAGPQRDLPAHEIRRLAVVGQSRRRPIDLMERRQCVAHGVVDRNALGLGHAGQPVVAEYPALDKIHHVKRRADDRRILAKNAHVRHRHGCCPQRLHDAVFAFHGMRGWQQNSRRLFTQDVPAVLRRHHESRIRLSADDALDLEGRGEFGKFARKIGAKRCFVEAQRHRHDRHARTARAV